MAIVVFSVCGLRYFDQTCGYISQIDIRHNSPQILKYNMYSTVHDTASKVRCTTLTTYVILEWFWFPSSVCQVVNFKSGFVASIPGEKYCTSHLLFISWFVGGWMY